MSKYYIHYRTKNNIGSKSIIEEKTKEEALKQWKKSHPSAKIVLIFKNDNPNPLKIPKSLIKKAPYIDYFVNDGPDTRHLIKTKKFSKLKDANAYIKKLPANRAYELTRLESPHGFSTKDTKSKVIKQRII